MTSEQLITCALDIGEQMLLCGAEINRVETSIRLICAAYGCQRTDVFTITSSIVVSIVSGEGTHHTQSRRITGGKTDLTRLDKLNSLSRQICKTTPDYESVQASIEKVCSQKTFPLWFEALGSMLIAFSFTVFFGGSYIDGLVASVLGFGLRYTTWLLQKANMNQIFVNVVASFVLSVSAIVLVRCGLGEDINKILIGNIMLLIPGIALTNSLRDMIGGDIISGLLRFIDAVLVAVAIAAGYILAASVLGGVL